MDDNPLIPLAETLQTASINPHPSAAHDVNPSTSASLKLPVELLSDTASDEIPSSILRPVPRKPQLPPLPDLRFEQSYLQSIQNAESWQGVTYITLRDHLFMPLVQGVMWTLVVAGWRSWNRAATMQGSSIGARVRRWWWSVNNWHVPGQKKGLADEKLAEQVQEVSLIIYLQVVSVNHSCLSGFHALFQF